MKRVLINIARLIAALLSIFLLCLIYGFLIEPKTLAIRKVEIVSDTWQGPPLTIGLMSDFHIGGMHVKAKRVAKVVRKMNALTPDITLIAGDFVNGHHPYVEWEETDRAALNKGMLALGQLHAPLGVYIALGNHDGYYGPRYVEAELTNAGLKVLENAHVTIDGEQQRFCLIGLSDFKTGKKDITVAQGCDDDQSIIAFMHSPDSFLYLPDTITLALAGHTHGGQVNLPFQERNARLIELGNTYAYGKLDYKGIPAFVTAGIGTSKIPARFRAPPEIVMITLRSGRSEHFSE
ncbi:MAG TPA: metallophosphoesterase [Hellea balneolensis]|uniref:Metallophosphoesterase n=1 Tax=Hellea balneolensis TaxID=287478 RepID=A0A7C3GBA9_9PROT|nr:metallophosphoesterase [Hellea balneolensis]